jgi:hypothetical protein
MRAKHLPAAIQVPAPALSAKAPHPGRAASPRRPGVLTPCTVLVMLLLSVSQGLGQTVTNALPATNTFPTAVEEEPGKWSFSSTISGYLVPDSRDYVQPTITADHAWLHLEARYNYENLDTGSTWLGYNFNGGKKLAWAVTPMLGGVFGDTTGVAPGYSGTLNWWKLELYSQGEYVLDTGDSSGSFLYNWSELSVSPTTWLRLGMVTQRTRAYRTDRDIQRGFLVGLSYKKLSFTAYVFNPDDSRPPVVLAAEVQF